MIQQYEDCIAKCLKNLTFDEDSLRKELRECQNADGVDPSIAERWTVAQLRQAVCSCRCNPPDGASESEDRKKATKDDVSKVAIDALEGRVAAGHVKNK